MAAMTPLKEELDSVARTRFKKNNDFIRNISVFVFNFSK
jgi:hypothetical protein